MYAQQEPPAVYFSVLAPSVIIVAAGACLLPPFGRLLFLTEVDVEAAVLAVISVHGQLSSCALYLSDFESQRKILGFHSKNY